MSFTWKRTSIATMPSKSSSSETTKITQRVPSGTLFFCPTVLTRGEKCAILTQTDAEEEYLFYSFQREPRAVGSRRRENWEWTSKGKRKRSVSLPSMRAGAALREKRSAYDGTRKVGAMRQAGWHRRNFSCPSKNCLGTGFFIFPRPTDKRLERSSCLNRKFPTKST